MNRLLIAFAFACATFPATADDVVFSGAGGKRLRTGNSSDGIPSINHRTWTATCRKGIAISGYCASHTGPRILQSVGVVEGQHWVCTWSDPTPNAVVIALCIFEE
jgi:hypothetical protein